MHLLRKISFESALNSKSIHENSNIASTDLRNFVTDECNFMQETGSDIAMSQAGNMVDTFFYVSCGLHASTQTYYSLSADGGFLLNLKFTTLMPGIYGATQDATLDPIQIVFTITSLTVYTGQPLPQPAGCPV